MSVDPLVGQMFGQYRIEAFLGSGGMAQVYRGIHTMLERPVALKVMLPHIANDPTFRARFLQEGKLVASLSHPNIVGVYDFGEKDGTFYLVMELLTDGSLQTLLAHPDQGGWSPPLGLALVRQAAEGLAYAHARGMVHRDIKPDNLLVRKVNTGTEAAGPPYQVKISDFGLARLAEGGMLTATGQTMGTPAYMSPEQCQGLELDGRSDLYSLGVVLFEVATGARPFAAKSLTEAVYQHVYTQPPRPSEVRPGLDPKLEAIILRCMAKHPAERFPSAIDLVGALNALDPAAAVGGATMVGPFVLPPSLPVTPLSVGAVAPPPPPPSVTPLPVAPSTAESSPAIPLPPVVPRPLATPIGVDRGRIRVLLDAGLLSLTPGQPAPVHLTLANLGTTVDHFTITVDGVPPGWVTGPAQAVQLNPHAQSTIVLSVQAPRSPGSYAGQYPVTVRARSRENPGDFGSATALWTVLPFTAPAVRLTPQRAGGHSRANYTLTVENGGNAPARFTLGGQDEEQALRYRFGQATVALDPFRSTTVPLTVAAPWRLIGKPLPRKFAVQAEPASGGPPLAAAGEFLHEALLPTWVIAIPPLLVAIFLLLRSMLQPTIDAFQPVPLNPVAGQPFYLTWQVHRAQQLEILPEHIKLDANIDHYIFPNGVDNPEDLTLVASNLLGSVQKKQAVTVVPPTPTATAVIPTATATRAPPTATATVEPGAPTIQRWQVTSPNGKALDAATLEVQPNTPVTLSWQVTNADDVQIDGIGTVDPSGSLQRTVLAGTTFTLKASNKGAHQVSRAIQVVVVTPTPLPTAVPTATPPPTATPQPTATPIPAAVVAPTTAPVVVPPPPAATPAPALPPEGNGGATGGKDWDALAVGHDAAGNEVIWSANATDGVVRRINVQSRAQAAFPVGKAPSSLLVTDAAIWVANGGDGTVRRLDPQSGQPVGTPIAVGKNPTALAVAKNAAGKDVVFVASAGDGTVQGIDTQTNQAQPPLTVAKGITAMAVSSDSLWLAVGADNTVRRITLQDGRPSGTPVTIAVGKGPSALSVARDAAGKETIWVAEAGDGAVQPVDPQMNKAGQPTAVGKAPSSLAFEQDTAGRALIWVANNGEATVQAIDGKTGAVVATAPVTASPARLATGKDQVWVLNQHDGNIQGVKVSG
jgi:eukaryotic-like serine/threonine-protein kinase